MKEKSLKNKRIEWSYLWYHFNTCSKFISEYDRIKDNKDLIKKFPFIEDVYMHSFITHASKIFSKSEKDFSTIEKLKKICKPEMISGIEKFEKKYLDIGSKIVKNRNKIIAHLDKNFVDMPFSLEAKEELIKNFTAGSNLTPEESKNIFSNLNTTKNKSEERYSVIDFKNDIPKIKTLLKEFEDIWQRAFPME